MAVQNDAKDPAAAAFLAIEEALNLVKLDPDADPAAGSQPDAPSEPVVNSGRGAPSEGQPALPPVTAERNGTPPADAPVPFVGLGETNDRTLARSTNGGLSTAGLHANDDRRSVGQLLAALQARPNSTPFVLAALGSAVWAVVCGYGLYAGGSFSGGLSAASLARPELLGGIGVLVGPIVFFFIIAALMRRIQDMRLTTRSMAAIAVRLAEPETIATEQVVSLSQAIRREVASMGDGIERALARAGELEAIVRNEVPNLKRS